MAGGPKQYLITGAAGQVGSALLHAFAEDEPEVTILGQRRESLDVTQRQVVLEQLGVLCPTAVVHTAGLSDWWEAESDRNQAFRVLVEGTDNVVKSCAKHGIPVILLSCHTVFGGYNLSQQRLLEETDPVRTCNHLSLCHTLAEHAVFRLGQAMSPELWRGGFRYWVLRLGAIFGHAAQYGQENLAGPLLRATASSRRREEVPYESDRYLSPLYLPHLVRVVRHLLANTQQVPCGVYHVANQGGCTPLEFGRALSYGLPHGISVQSSNRKDKSQRLGIGPEELQPGFTGLNTEKMTRYMGLTLPSWQAAVEEFSDTLSLHSMA